MAGGGSGIPSRSQTLLNRGGEAPMRIGGAFRTGSDVGGVTRMHLSDSWEFGINILASERCTLHRHEVNLHQDAQEAI